MPLSNRELLQLQADATFKELLSALEGVSEQQAWAKCECQPEQYLHTEGSILSVVMHVAACKFLYGSCAYRGMEVRWRDTVERLEGIWPNWEAAKAYLNAAHEYWLASWAGEDDFERLVKNFRDQEVPSWRIVNIMNHHDAWHGGQIVLLASILPPSTTPPPAEGDLWRQWCGELPSW